MNLCSSCKWEPDWGRTDQRTWVGFCRHPIAAFNHRNQVVEIYRGGGMFFHRGKEVVCCDAYQPKEPEILSINDHISPV